MKREIFQSPAGVIVEKDAETRPFLPLQSPAIGYRDQSGNQKVP